MTKLLQNNFLNPSLWSFSEIPKFDIIRVVAYLISRLSVTSVCMGLELNKAFKDEAAKRTRALEVAAGA